jgi:hypothetical protein
MRSFLSSHQFSVPLVEENPLGREINQVCNRITIWFLHESRKRLFNEKIPFLQESIKTCCVVAHIVCFLNFATLSGNIMHS